MYNFQSKPTVLSRAEWGARSRSKTPRQRDGVRYLVVHHCAGNNNTIENTSEQARMREIQRIHMDDNGWSDIAYNFGVGKGGTIMEGLEIDYAMKAAGGSNNNYYAIHINCHGNFEEKLFDWSQKSALIDLLAYLCSRYGLSESAIIGHYNMSSSACPGQAIKDAIPSIRTNVKVRLNGASPY